MAIQSFDDFNEDGVYNAQLAPFQFREKKGKEETLEWLNNNFDRMYDGAEARYGVYRRHLNMYKNIKDDGADGLARTSNRDRGVAYKKPVIKVNKAYEYIESRVAQVSRQKINVALVPHNDSEQEDLNNAKSCKIFLDARSEEIDLDRVHRDGDRINFLYGSVIFGVYWDEDAGPISPAWQEAVKKYGEDKVPKLDDSGKKMDGEYVAKAPHIGDVCVKTYNPFEFFIDPEAKNMEEAKFIEVCDWKHIEEVKADYPRAAKKIEGGGSGDPYQGTVRCGTDHVVRTPACRGDPPGRRDRGLAVHTADERDALVGGVPERHRVHEADLWPAHHAGAPGRFARLEPPATRQAAAGCAR